jgi:hypothetical protein
MAEALGQSGNQEKGELPPLEAVTRGIVLNIRVSVKVTPQV